MNAIRHVWIVEWVDYDDRCIDAIFDNEHAATEYQRRQSQTVRVQEDKALGSWYAFLGTREHLIWAGPDEAHARQFAADDQSSWFVVTRYDVYATSGLAMLAVRESEDGDA